MNAPPADMLPPAAMPPAADLRLAEVEARLAALSAAVQKHDASLVTAEALALQQALAAFARHIAAAAAAGQDLMPQREQLVALGQRVASQRQAVARAGGAFDRSLDVLLPPRRSPVYTAAGLAGRPASGSAVQA